MSKELLKDPINYAKGAIDALQAQLEKSISKYKKIKLNSKITQWKKFVELMEGEENVSKAEESI